MVAVLLSAGAKPNLVTDPTPKNPGGSTAADLASLRGYEGLAAFLPEKALVEQFNDMSIAGNISGSLDTSSSDAAAFRGFQVRRQFRKILWSVGVLEKAVLRWRLKRKGFRGFQVDPMEVVPDQSQESDTEEDFYRASRQQAEERVERSVVRVQAMFRSKKAQEEYRRMKLTHNEAKLEFEGFLDPDTDMS
ncbi:calmodulin-binding transcription activator 5 [Fagus crenata]